MSQTKTYPPSDAMSKGAHVDAATYTQMYKASKDDPDGFWAEQGKRIDWIKPFTEVKDTKTPARWRTSCVIWAWAKAIG